MRLSRTWCALLIPFCLSGCFADRSSIAARWRDRLPLFRSAPDVDTAFTEYVLVERPAGGDDINRNVWDRIDEQVIPYETRAALEELGLRAGTIGDSTPGPLRGMIDDPRTGRGHRFRSFALDKAAPWMVNGPLAKAEFTAGISEGTPIRFAKDDVQLGFEITIREVADGKVLVRFVPQARFREPLRLLASATGERDQGSATFPTGAFEIALAPTEYLVIGTEEMKPGTFGHCTFTEQKESRNVQRLLVLRAGLTRAVSDGKNKQTGAAPLASQAGVARASQD